MKIIYIFLTFLVSLFIFSNICIPQTKFQCVIGGTGNDVAASMVQANDGSYIIAGTTNSFGAGDLDILITKISYNGALQWSKTYGGTGQENIFSLIKTSDGGYAACGFRKNYGSTLSDFYVLKIDANGNIQWDLTFGSTSSIDEARKIIQTTAGDYVIAGVSDDDIYIAKLNNSGALQWSKKIRTTGYDCANCIIQTADGGFLLSGIYGYYGSLSGDMYFVKMDPDFNILWSKNVGNSNYENAYSLIQTANNGYVAAGQSVGFGYCIVKLNGNGALQWDKYVCDNGGGDYASSIVQTSDGGYAIVGYTSPYPSNGDVGLAKLDSAGNLQWVKKVGGTNREYGGSIINTMDGGFAILTTSKSFGLGNDDMYFVKFDSDWNTCGNTNNMTFMSNSNGNITTENSIIYSTTVSTFSYPILINSAGTVVTNICSSIGIINQENNTPKRYELSQNYPNPFNPSTNIKYQITNSNLVTLKIFDILGKEVATLVNEKQSPGTYEATWNASNYPSGVYFYKIQADDFSETRKMILLK